jgi:hypothetical protein
MTMNGNDLCDEAKALVKDYSEGNRSAEATGYDLWERKLTLPGEPDPHAGDVIQWSKELGYGIPSESAEEARASADRALEYFRAKDRNS